MLLFVPLNRLLRWKNFNRLIRLVSTFQLHLPTTRGKFSMIVWINNFLLWFKVQFPSLNFRCPQRKFGSPTVPKVSDVWFFFLLQVVFVQENRLFLLSQCFKKFFLRCNYNSGSWFVSSNLKANRPKVFSTANSFSFAEFLATLFGRRQLDFNNQGVNRQYCSRNVFFRSLVYRALPSAPFQRKYGRRSCLIKECFYDQCSYSNSNFW